MKSCPRSGEFDRSTGSNALYHDLAIPIRKVVSGTKAIPAAYEVHYITESPAFHSYTIVLSKKFFYMLKNSLATEC